MGEESSECFKEYLASACQQHVGAWRVHGDTRAGPLPSHARNPGTLRCGWRVDLWICYTHSGKLAGMTESEHTHPRAQQSCSCLYTQERQTSVCTEGAARSAHSSFVANKRRERACALHSSMDGYALIGPHTDTSPRSRPAQSWGGHSCLHSLLSNLIQGDTPKEAGPRRPPTRSISIMRLTGLFSFSFNFSDR